MFGKAIVHGQSTAGNQLKLLCKPPGGWLYDNAEGNIIAFFRGPHLTPLPFARGLLMGKDSHAMLRQTLPLRQAGGMNQLSGIVVGTVNRLQFNEWCIWLL